MGTNPLLTKWPALELKSLGMVHGFAMFSIVVNAAFSVSCLLHNATTSLIRLIGLAFACALGVTFLVLACALPQYNNWWPMFVLFFYFLSPLPTIVARRLTNSYDSSSSACIELCIFFTTGIVISAIGLPVVLAHTEVIAWGACALVISGNTVVFLTIFGYFKVFGNDDIEYNMW